jgi:hypothetical protein
MVRIKVLYFDGCPSWRQAVENLEAALEAEGLAAEVELVKIEEDAAAQAQHFLGSPSFCVDGRDLWPEERSEFALDCRVYATPEGLKGWPTVAMLRERLRNLPST